MGGFGSALIVAVVVQSGPAELRVGLAASGNDGLCIALPGAAVPLGSPFTVVTDEEPQHVYHATVLAAVPVCDAMQHNPDGRFYMVALLDAPSDALVGALGVAFPGRVPMRRAGRRVQLKLNAGHQNAQVRICSSSEGLHATVWSGTPLRSARLWHQYWYLGYDVEPDCQPADYEPR